MWVNTSKFDNTKIDKNNRFQISIKICILEPSWKMKINDKKNPASLAPLAKRSQCAKTYLHANNAIDEENETNQNGNPGQSLKGFDEGPKQSSNTFTFAQKFHEPHDTEETEEIDRDHVPSRL